jgi:hypothetical protein
MSRSATTVTDHHNNEPLYNKDMSNILEIIANLEKRLWAQYGNPLASYKKTQDDVHMTYYVGKLVQELGHKWVSPKRISGEKEDIAYFSEKAMHDAFLAGRLIERKDMNDLRKTIRDEIKHELMETLQDAINEL